MDFGTTAEGGRGLPDSVIMVTPPFLSLAEDVRLPFLSLTTALIVGGWGLKQGGCGLLRIGINYFETNDVMI